MALKEGNHGVIAIHGVEAEETKRGKLLANLTNSLADTLLESPAGEEPNQISPTIRREANFTDDPARVILKITAPDKSEATWDCREAFWAESFLAPRASSVLKWTIKLWAKQAGRIKEALLRDPVNQTNYRPPPPSGTSAEEPVYKPRGLIKAIYRLELAVIVFLFTPLSLLIIPILYIAWPLYWLPQFGRVAKVIHKVLHSADAFMSDVLGDAKRLIEHGVWAASARGILERIIIDMLEDDKIADITIVAHSAGCVVSYDALRKGGPVAEAVGERENAGKSGKKLTLITVGSALKLVMGVARESNLYARTHFMEPIDERITGNDPKAKLSAEKLREKFFWLDIRARLDPLTFLQMDAQLAEHAGVNDAQWKTREVINLDNILRDHTYYWMNRDLVIPRIARCINGGEYPWEEAGVTEKKLRHHYDRIAYLGLLRLVMLGIIGAGAIMWALIGLGPLASLPAWVPPLVIAVGIGMYQALRSWKFGEIS